GSQASGGAGADDIIGVTYAGFPMTLAVKLASATIGSYIYLYGLMNPPTGANNVVITAASTHQIWAGAASYLGVNQIGLVEAVTTNQGASTAVTSLTTTLTPWEAECWTVLVESTYDGGTPPVAGTGSTRRVYEAAFGTWAIFDSNGAAAA